MKPTVFLGMPHYSSQVHLAAAESFFVHATIGDAVDVVCRETYGGSLTMKSFNMLWAKALRMHEAGRVRYFAMLHSDIGAERGWLDTLVRLIESNAADVVSVVSPLKNPDGITSTGIDDPLDRYDPLKRFTMHEIAGFKSTFSASDAGFADGCLLVNTGCFIADLDKEWARKTIDGRLLSSFRFDDCVREDGGNLQVCSESEDWILSRMLHREGAKVLATTEVAITHFGEIGFSNQGAWGRCKVDPRSRAEAAV